MYCHSQDERLSRQLDEGVQYTSINMDMLHE